MWIKAVNGGSGLLREIFCAKHIFCKGLWDLDCVMAAWKPHQWSMGRGSWQTHVMREIKVALNALCSW